MADIYPPTVQRPALLAFAEACATRANCLRRDECGDWAIFGNSFQLMIGCDFEPRWSSARGWTEAKRRLAFGKVTQDGDEEGAIILERLPTQEEATQIRLVLGIPMRRQIVSETLLKVLSEGRIKRLLVAKTAAEVSSSRALPVHSN
jgi:hypothetical protein